MTTHAFAGAAAPYVRLLARDVIRGRRGSLTTIVQTNTYLTRCGRYVDAAQLVDPTRRETPTCQACARQPVSATGSSASPGSSSTSHARS